MAGEIDFKNGRNSNFEGLVTLTSIGPYGIPSCITDRPLPIYQISFKLKKLFVDGRTYGRTYGWTDISPLYIIRSTFRSRPKNTNKKTSHFFVYSRRMTHDPHHTWQGDRGDPFRFCTPLTFLDPISSFATRGYWKFITWLFVSRKQPKYKLKIHLETRTKSENFVKKMGKRETPEGQFYGQNSKFW